MTASSGKPFNPDLGDPSQAGLTYPADAYRQVCEEAHRLRAENERLRHRADNPHVACSCALCAMRHERDRLDDLLREANEDGFGWKPRAEVAEAQVKRVQALCEEAEYVVLADNDPGLPPVLAVAVVDLRAALGEPGSEGDAKLTGNSGAEPGRMT